MKRILLALAAVVAFSFVAVAQPRAVGLRAGNYGMDVSYENYAGEFDFLEFELGLDDAFNTNAFHFDGVYNIMIAQPDWSAYGQWGIYAGIWSMRDSSGTLGWNIFSTSRSSSPLVCGHVLCSETARSARTGFSPWVLE